MGPLFTIFTILFIIVSVAMSLIILVQRPSGGGLAGAFGGAGGGTDTVFGGRIGDALTWATVIAFVLYLLFSIGLNRAAHIAPAQQASTTESVEGAPEDLGTGEPVPEETGGPSSDSQQPITEIPSEPEEGGGDETPADTGDAEAEPDTAPDTATNEETESRPETPSDNPGSDEEDGGEGE